MSLYGSRKLKPLVFNCTAALPYSHETITDYVKALRGDPIMPGLINIDVRHDDDPSGYCPNCGCPLGPR